MSHLHPNDELLAAYVANELAPAERAAFAVHLAGCPACADALRQTESIRALLRTLAPQPMASESVPSLASDVLARLGHADEPGASPESPVRLVSSLPSVLSARSQPDLPRELSNLPIGQSEARGTSFRRSRIMRQRTRDSSEHAPARAGDDASFRRPPAPTHRSRPLLAVAAVLVLALLSYALFGVLGPRMPHGPASGTHATATASKLDATATPVQIPGMAIDPHTGLPADTKDSGFSKVQAFGPNDLWGLGYFWQTARNKTQQGVSYTFFAHFDGQKWTIWPVPLANIALTSFSMDSDTDGWAVGSLSSVDFEHGVLVHFANGVITIVQMPGAGQLFSVQMLSATEGWAVGNAPSDGTQPISGLSPVTLHYVNGAWSLVPNTLYPEGAGGLSMDSSDHGWIITALGHFGYLADGRWVQWHQGFAADLHSVSSFAPNNAWAVGNTAGSPTSEPSPVILHFDGHSWSPVTIPALSQSTGAMLSQVTMVSPTDGWISGLLLAPLNSSQPQEETPILLHYNGRQWQPAAAPANIEFNWISLSSPGDVWALGWSLLSGAARYLFHYHNGAWSIVSQFG